MKRKLFVTILSLILVVTMMPLSVFANTNNAENEEPKYGTHEYWEKTHPNHTHVEHISVGQEFTDGVYFFDKDFHVSAADVEGSAIVIKGNVTFVLENCNLTFEGAPAKATIGANAGIGAGAGIEVTEGNSLWIKGVGSIDAKGGDGAQGLIGDNGEKADTDNSGDGGKGGHGGGGAAAGIGTMGGNGSVGGEHVDGRHEGSAYKEYAGRDGNAGGNGGNSANAGQIKISGNVQVNAVSGNATDEIIKSTQKGGLGAYEISPMAPFSPPATEIGGGGAGGSGGNGYPAANIGTGGAGGGAGGSGGSGGIEQQWGWESHTIYYPAGGGGGSGQGYMKQGSDEKELKLGGCYCKTPYIWGVNDGRVFGTATPGGKGMDEDVSVHAGDGKAGGVAGVSGMANGSVLATTLQDAAASAKDNNCGMSTAVRNVYPVDECQFKTIDGDINLVHIPTETVLEKDKDYSFKIAQHNDVVKVIASGGKLVDSSMEKSGQKTGLYKATSYTVNHYLQNLTDTGTAAGTYSCVDSEILCGITNTMTQAKARNYNGFTAEDITQKVIKEDGRTVINIYYNRNVHTVTFNMGEHSALFKSKVETKLCYGAPIAKFLPEGYDLAERGFKFNGWSQVINDETVMGDQDIEFTAKWVALTPATYTAKIYVQDLSKDQKEAANTYSLLSEEVKDGCYVGEMTDVHPEVEGFHAKPFEQKVIQEDGKTVVEVYMDRDVYDMNLTFTYGSIICQRLGVNQTTIPVKVCYGASIEKNMPEDYNKSIRGYRFAGFSPRLNPSEKASPETITDKDYLAIFAGTY